MLSHKAPIAHRTAAGCFGRTGGARGTTTRIIEQNVVSEVRDKNGHDVHELVGKARRIFGHSDDDHIGWDATAKHGPTNRYDRRTKEATTATGFSLYRERAV